MSDCKTNEVDFKVSEFLRKLADSIDDGSVAVRSFGFDRIDWERDGNGEHLFSFPSHLEVWGRGCEASKAMLEAAKACLTD